MLITGHTRVFAIVGSPVEQVRAPELFNALFVRHGVDAVMVPIAVAPAGLAAFVEGAVRAGSLAGVALTIPHKQGVMPLLDRCDEQARSAGGANALRRGADGALEGALFDGLGFVRAVCRLGRTLRGRRVLIVGAGGAGAAIASALAATGGASIVLADVLPGRAEALAARLAQAMPDTVFEACAAADPAGFDLVVNATPLGLSPADPLPFDAERVRPDALVVDILMTPAPTPLQRACAVRGITCHDGREMLVQQMPDYLSFFGFDSIADALRAELDELRRLIAAR